MNEYDDAIQKQTECAGQIGPAVRNREIIPNLKAQRDELVRRIGKIDTLLGLLERNPDFVKMLDLTRDLI